MAHSIEDVQLWSLPDPKEVISRALEFSHNPRSDRAHWVFTAAISPLELYLLLKSRFGAPNGTAMLLRHNSADNLIHWNYSLNCREAWFDIIALTDRIEIRVFGERVNEINGGVLESNLNDEIRRRHDELKVVKEGLEHWRTFINPYRRLELMVDSYAKRLLEIELPEVGDIPIPPTQSQWDEFVSQLQTANRLYHEAAAICISLTMVCPVMGEAAVNFLFFMLGKPEYKRDKRLREEIGRRAIDVRIKTLHLNCNGFERGITGDEPEFKSFMRLMNRRNDLLHGNVDPERDYTGDIYYDYRFIPLPPRKRAFQDAVLQGALTNLSPKEVLQEVVVVRNFVGLLLENLKSEVRPAAERMLQEEQPGYRAANGALGAVLPSTQVGFFPVSGEQPPTE